MTVLELVHELEDWDDSLEIEISYRTPGYYPDDHDTHYVKPTEVHLNKARNTLVIE